MTENEQLFLSNYRAIQNKLKEIEEEEVNRGLHEDKHKYMKEFSWDKSYSVEVTANVPYSISGNYECGSLQEAKDYEDGRRTLEYCDVDWYDDLECLAEVEVDNIDVSIENIQLKNPSDEYKKVKKEELINTAVETLNTTLIAQLNRLKLIENGVSSIEILEAVMKKQSEEVDKRLGVK